MARNVLYRSMAKLMARRVQPVAFTSEGAVSISYSTLVSSPLSLQASIGEFSANISSFISGLSLHTEEAFGSHPKSLGIIVVKDLPPIYVTYRERLLKLAYKFATLDENTRERHADPGTNYRFVKFPRSFFLIQFDGINTKLRVVAWKGKPSESERPCLLISKLYFRK
jgi:hypothetical protein